MRLLLQMVFLGMRLRIEALVIWGVRLILLGIIKLVKRQISTSINKQLVKLLVCVIGKKRWLL